MTIETVYGEYVLGRAKNAPVRTGRFHNFDQTYRNIMDHAVLPAGAEATSVIYLAEVKPDSILSMLGLLSFDALGASTTLSIGLADDAEIGLSGKAALLNAAASTASAGSMSVGAAIDRANWFKPLWTLAGLTAKPTKKVSLIATLGGATSAAGGDLAWEIPFVTF